MSLLTTVASFVLVLGIIAADHRHPDAEHMKQDLDSRDLALSSEEVHAIESLVG